MDATGASTVVNVLANHSVTPSEVTQGLSATLLRATVALLKNDTALIVRMKVTFDGASSEADARLFPAAQFIVKTTTVVEFTDFESGYNGWVGHGNSNNETVSIQGAVGSRYASATASLITGLKKNLTPPLPAGKYRYEVRFMSTGGTHHTGFAIYNKSIFSQASATGGWKTISGTLEFDVPVLFAIGTVNHDRDMTVLGFYLDYFKLTRIG